MILKFYGWLVGAKIVSQVRHSGRPGPGQDAFFFVGGHQARSPQVRVMIFYAAGVGFFPSGQELGNIF